MTADSQGFVLWFTGLPCSGKTTLSDRIEEKFRAAGRPVEHLDGDRVRKSISSRLGYSRRDRETNVWRVAELAAMRAREGAAVLVSLVSPYRSMRRSARKLVSPACFVEIYVRCSLAVCEKRDTKGMYKLAREGRIKNFTGISDPYQKPLDPEIVVDTERMDAGLCIEKILNYLEKEALVRPGWAESRTECPAGRISAA